MQFHQVCKSLKNEKKYDISLCKREEEKKKIESLTASFSCVLRLAKLVLSLLLILFMCKQCAQSCTSQTRQHVLALRGL